MNVIGTWYRADEHVEKDIIMLSPDLSLKMSAAGIRLTGYVIETNLRVARVFGQAALRSGSFSKPVIARAEEPVETKPLIKREKQHTTKASLDAGAPERLRSVKGPQTVIEIASKTAEPVESLAEVKSVPLAEMTSIPVSETKPGMPTNLRIETGAGTQPAAAPKVKSPRTSEARPAALASKPVISVAVPKAAAPGTGTATSASVAAAVEKITESTGVKRPRAPSMPPALPEAPKKTKSE